MDSIRLLKTEDIPAARKLWQARFFDSDRFLDWYFRERFKAGFAAGIFSFQNELICQAHFRPMSLKSDNGIISVLMIGGVSTDQTYEKQGCMHRVLEYIENLAVNEGYDALFLAAEHPEIYHSAGFRDCASCIRVYSSGQNYCSETKLDSADPLLIEKLLSVYRKVSVSFDYSPVREYDDMHQRAREFFSTGCRLIPLQRDSVLTGYAFYDPESQTAEEVYSVSAEDYRSLLGLLPPDTLVTLPPDQTGFGKPETLSLIKPLRSFNSKASPLLGFCPETY